MILGRRLAAVLLGCAILATFCSGMGLERLRIGDLAGVSDLIAVADIREVKSLGPAEPVAFRDQTLEAAAYSAELTVRRVIKGSAPSRTIVRYALPLTFVGYRGLHVGMRLVFLKRRDDGYGLADRYYPDFPAVAEKEESTTIAPGYVGEILGEMLSVLASPTSTPAEKLEILRVDYVLPKRQETVASLRRGLAAAQGDDLSQRLQGELLDFGDVEELPHVVGLFLTNNVVGGQKVRLLYTIANSIRDPRAIPTLRPLLQSNDASVRSAAVQALWHIADRTAVPDLSKALRDTDEQVRFYAVRAFADIANEQGWGGPSESEFHQHQQKYLAHWQEWMVAQAP